MSAPIRALPAAALALVAASCVAAAGCRSAPTAGTGDVAFRLLWEGQSDVDLHVVDPALDHLFFARREAASGGTLDVDCNAGSDRLCERPIENVFWPLGGAPAGEYRFWARAHSVIPAEAPLEITLLVLAGDRVVERLTGELGTNEELFGPFSVRFPPADGWEVVRRDRSILDDGPELALRCADGLAFRVVLAPAGAILRLAGETVRLAANPLGGSYGHGETTFWWLGDEGELVLPSGRHTGCQKAE